MKTHRCNTVEAADMLRWFIEKNPKLDEATPGILPKAMEILQSAGATHLSLKSCTKCGNLFPATKEYFAYLREAADGLKYECRQCGRAYTNRHRYKKRHDAAMGPEDVAEIERHRKLMEEQGVKNLEVNF